MADLLLPLEGGTAQPPLRRCSKCGATKDPDQFFDRGDGPGKRSECKACSAVALAVYRSENPRPWDPIKGKKWRESTYRIRRATLLGWVTINVRTRRQQCRKRGIEFTITAEDVLQMYETQGGRCALTGRELKWGPDTNRGSDTMSVDRLDALGPYIRANIRLVTHWANVARQRLSDEELFAFCEAVLATRTAAR